MINYNTKDKGMIYTLNGKDYVIQHDYFKVIDFVELEDEDKVKIHIQNENYDTVITPYEDSRERLSKGCTIFIAYIVTDYGISCHGYEVRDDIDWSKLSITKDIKLVSDDIDIVKYKTILYKYIGIIKSEEIKRFVSNILEKKWLRFSRWQAGTKIHHNYKSGLLQHTVNVVKNAYNIAFNYNDIDLDLVIVGAILHDIGKIYEYDEEGNISGEGKLFDHINIGTRIVFEEYYHGEDETYKFSERDLYHIAHIILSHHGKLEWGSSKTPATQEAFIVHYADYIDTNMFIVHRELSQLDIDKSIKTIYTGQLLQTKFSMDENYDKN